jgi:hypothetical protein
MSENNKQLKESIQSIDRENYTVDRALKQIGGFGRFQTLSLICLTVMRNGGNYLYYGFSFLTMEQSYLCRSETSQDWESCSNVCIEGVEFVADTSSPDYVENWM